jgi:outer membrane receptor for ferrienterochelin and colicins
VIAAIHIELLLRLDTFPVYAARTVFRTKIFIPKLDKRNSMHYHVRGGGRVVILCSLAMLCRAQSSTVPSVPSAADAADALDLQSLLNMKVVTASKFQQDLSDAPGIIRVVTRDEMQRFGGLTLREILERVAGLARTSTSFTDRSMVAAGGDQTKDNGGHVLFLINGRPTREVQEGGVISDLMEAFPIAILERIEVIEGPGSVLYGSNAFSGVVNLITRKAQGEEFSVAGFGGSSGPHGGTADVLIKRVELEITGAAQVHESPDWQVDYRTPAALLSGTGHGPLPVQQNFEIPDRSIGGYLGMNYKGLSLMSSVTEWRSAYFAGGGPGLIRWRRGFADLGYELKASSRWDMNFNLTYTRTGLNSSAAIPIGRDSSDTVAEWANTVHATRRDQITFGALYNYSQGQERFLAPSPGFISSEGSQSGPGFYAQIDHRLSDRIDLIGGFQIDKTESVPVAVLPRAGLIWSPASRWRVKALYGDAFRAPSLNERLIQTPFLTGNPGLKPERVATLDVGVYYQADRISTGINYFHSHQTNSIVQVFAEGGLGTYQNIGVVTLGGIEWESKVYFHQGWFVSGSILFNTDQGPLDNSPTSPLGAKAGVSYKSSSGWAASIFEIYQGHIDGYPYALNPKPAAYNLVTAHGRIPLARYVGPAAKHLALFAHGDNLLNSSIWLPDWGSNTGDTIPVVRGRTVYFGLEVAWKKD